jgi:hypothetical protein
MEVHRNGGYVLHADYEELERYGRQADITIENLQLQVEKLAAENTGLNAFVDALLSIAWQGGSADGAEIQEMALKHGLLRQEVYSADEHETLVDDPGNFEDGDPVYFRVEAPEKDAFLAEVRAQGVEMFAAWNDKHIKPGVEHKESLTAVSHAARGFAAQLRKGAQS